MRAPFPDTPQIWHGWNGPLCTTCATSPPTATRPRAEAQHQRTRGLPSSGLVVSANVDEKPHGAQSKAKEKEQEEGLRGEVTLRFWGEHTLWTTMCAQGAECAVHSARVEMCHLHSTTCTMHRVLCCRVHEPMHTRCGTAADQSSDYIFLEARYPPPPHQTHTLPLVTANSPKRAEQLSSENEVEKAGPTSHTPARCLLPCFIALFLGTADLEKPPRSPNRGPKSDKAEECVGKVLGTQMCMRLVSAPRHGLMSALSSAEGYCSVHAFGRWVRVGPPLRQQVLPPTIKVHHMCQCTVLNAVQLFLVQHGRCKALHCCASLHCARD